MPRPRFSKLSAEKREQIIEAAAKEFVTYGYEGSSLNRILEEVGLSKGAAYYYFDDKADVFATVANHYMVRFLTEANLDLDRLTADTFWPRLMNLYSQLLTRLPKEPWIMMVWKMSSRLTQDARTNPVLADMFNQGFAWFMAFLKRGQDLGIVRTDLPDDLLFALFRSVDTAGDQWLLDHWEDLETEKALDIMLRVFDGIQRLLMP